MQSLISLIAATGLRVGETLTLDRHDTGPDTGMLTVTGKNDQMRMVPLHTTTSAMLAGYAARRDRLCPHPASRRSSSPVPVAGSSNAGCTKPSPGWWPWPASPHRPDGAGPGSMTSDTLSRSPR